MGEKSQYICNRVLLLASHNGNSDADNMWRIVSNLRLTLLAFYCVNAVEKRYSNYGSRQYWLKNVGTFPLQMCFKAVLRISITNWPIHQN